jgi:hypothetical protein
MISSWITKFVGGLAGGALLVSIAACDSKIEVPSHWAEMGVPLGDGELRRKEEQSHERISIDHDGILQTQKVCLRYQEALERAGMVTAVGQGDRDDTGYFVRTLDDGGKMVKLRCINAMDKSVVQIEYDDGQMPPRRAKVGRD